MEEADYQAWLVSASEQFASKMKDSNNIELVKLIK
jgi:hypothetical protein